LQAANLREGRCRYQAGAVPRTRGGALLSQAGGPPL
jgi:hypothetical protein